MCGAVIRCRLDLMLRLIDTTTGAAITEGDVRFYWNGEFTRSDPRDSGIHIFLNRGRDNGLMRIEAKGYDPMDLEVDYEQLDSQLPGIDVFLIPSENTYRGGGVITFSGHLSRLEAIDAINVSKPVCSISEFNAKKNTMSLFLPGRRLTMGDVYYGLVNKEDGTYEKFKVEEEKTDTSIRLSEPLKEPFQVNAPICRIIFGSVDKKGNFILRVRDNGGDQNHLVRFTVGGEERFMNVDFEHLDEVKLSQAKPRPEKPSEEEGKETPSTRPG